MIISILEMEMSVSKIDREYLSIMKLIQEEKSKYFKEGTIEKENFDQWFHYHQPVLKHLFDELNVSAYDKGIDIEENGNSITFFILMMYLNSPKSKMIYEED